MKTVKKYSVYIPLYGTFSVTITISDNGDNECDIACVVSNGNTKLNFAFWVVNDNLELQENQIQAGINKVFVGLGFNKNFIHISNLAI